MQDGGGVGNLEPVTLSFLQVHEGGVLLGVVTVSGSPNLVLTRNGTAAFLKVTHSSCCSVAQTLCDPEDCSSPGFPVLHCLPEFAQTHIQ